MNTDKIWEKLLQYKKFLGVEDSIRCGIDSYDENMIKEDISIKLSEGWSFNEVVDYLKWTEYFDDYTHSEEMCLAKMKAITNKVKSRLGSYIKNENL